MKEIARGAKKPSLELAIEIEKITEGHVQRENWYFLDDAEINLDQASINFFQAIFRTAAEIFGHPRFIFRVDVEVGTNRQDAEHINALNQIIQKSLSLANEAVRPLTIEDTLTVADRTVQPVTIEGTTLQ